MLVDIEFIFTFLFFTELSYAISLIEDCESGKIQFCVEGKKRGFQIFILSSSIIT